ncbi:MAG: RIP metalloprotease RseP, partial [Spirochaetales bacterium]
MTIIYGLLGLGVIIFVHELGHFIAARACGVRVETFSVGMGPVLIHKKIGDTDYRLSLIPLGGYCGMRGEKAFQEALDKKLDYIPHEEHSFYGVHPLRRIIIAFAGPFSNLLFAIVAMSVIAMVGYTYYTTPSRIILATQVYENMDSRAEEAGLQTGDIITSINGKPVEYFSDISQTVSLSPEEVLVIQVLRGSQQLEFTLLPELDTSTGAGRIGVVNWVDPVVQAVLPGSVADIAGLMP